DQKYGGKVAIYNEYGPTEATVGCMIYQYQADDATASVPIGKPVDNTQIYLLDGNFSPVPQGAIGELYIAGAGLALGYFDNPEMTTEKFIDNPFAEGGTRMYRTGDLARWLEDGNIEYLGRFGDQVKIRGFRIELGEIAHHLTQYDQIRDSIVLDREQSDTTYLVAYYLADDEVDTTLIRDYLTNLLPEYMIPFHYVRMDEWPLTNNGKLDKKALPEIKMHSATGFKLAQTKEEKLLAQVWSQVLGIEHPGLNDHFFSLGGDSIKSVQVSSRMRGHGYELSVSSIMSKPTISEMAKVLTPILRASDQSPVSGSLPLTPIQRWFFDGTIAEKDHYNQSVFLRFKERLDAADLVDILSKLQDHHDALRTIFSKEGDEVTQHVQDIGLPVALEEIDLTNSSTAETVIQEKNQALQESIQLDRGPLLKAVLYQLAAESRLILVIHHLVVDGISWRILFEDLESLMTQKREGKSLNLPLKTDSYQFWSDRVQVYQNSDRFEKAGEYWEALMARDFDRIRRDQENGSNTYGIAKKEVFSLNEEATQHLLTKAPTPFNTEINDLLLVALLLSTKETFGIDVLKVDMEGHGREQLDEDVNISRTIGWFTTIFPQVLDYQNEALSSCIKRVKELNRGIPNHGLDYLPYKFQSRLSQKQQGEAQLSFNYLGQFDADIAGKSFEFLTEGKGEDISLAAERLYDLELIGIIIDGKLEMSISYSPEQYDKETMSSFMTCYHAQLKAVIDYCVDYKRTELTPSDLSYDQLSLAVLDQLNKQYELTDVYPLSPMQEGMLFHALYDPESAQYYEQVVCSVRGELDLEKVSETMNDLIQRHEILRTLFVHEGQERPLQVVLNSRAITVICEDLRTETSQLSVTELIEKYKSADKQQKFDLSKDSLIRLTILRIADDLYEFIWSYHHILMDGWCMGLLINEFEKVYTGKLRNEPVQLAPVQPYSNYIQWIALRDTKASAEYWKDYLFGYESLTGLPKPLSRATEDFEHQTSHFVLSKGQTQGLHLLSVKYGVTVNTIIQTAWAVLLSKYNNTTDVLFGAVVSGRPSDLEGVETMIGMFINTLPVRVQYDQKDTVAALLQRVQRDALASEVHQFHSLPDIQAENELGRDLLDHILIFENFPIQSATAPDNRRSEGSAFTIESAAVYEQTNYDLAITVNPGDELKFKLDFNSKVYKADNIE
ncbi:MAG: condensation domain-containing protein, partial [Bacteroidota bacterium]